MLRTLTSQILSINLGLTNLRKIIEETIDSAPTEFQARVKLASSITGIGNDLAGKLVAEFGDPHRFSNRREVSKYTDQNPPLVLLAV